MDLLYNVSGYHIKESIIVKAPQAQYRFSFRLNLEGLTPALEEDGSVTLSDSEGAIVYLIPAPYLFDAANHASDAAAYSLSGSAEEGVYSDGGGRRGLDECCGPGLPGDH